MMQALLILLACLVSCIRSLNNNDTSDINVRLLLRKVTAHQDPSLLGVVLKVHPGASLKEKCPCECSEKNELDFVEFYYAKNATNLDANRTFEIDPDRAPLTLWKHAHSEAHSKHQQGHLHELAHGDRNSFRLKPIKREVDINMSCFIVCGVWSDPSLDCVQVCGNDGRLYSLVEPIYNLLSE